MALRPVSPVHLVTRTLRIAWSAYHASAWYADRYRYTRATFGTLCAAALAAGTDCAGCAETSVPNRKVRRQPEHAVGSSKDETAFGQARSSFRQLPYQRSSINLVRLVEPRDIVENISARTTQLPESPPIC